MPTATRERVLFSLSGGKTNGRTRMLGRSDARRTAREQKPDTRVTLNRAVDEKRTRLSRPISMTDRIVQFHGSFEVTVAYILA